MKKIEEKWKEELKEEGTVGDEKSEWNEGIEDEREGRIEEKSEGTSGKAHTAGKELHGKFRWPEGDVLHLYARGWKVSGFLCFPRASD